MSMEQVLSGIKIILKINLVLSINMQDIRIKVICLVLINISSSIF